MDREKLKVLITSSMQSMGVELPANQSHYLSAGASDNHINYLVARIDMLSREEKWICVDERLPVQVQSNRNIPVIVALNGRTVTSAVFDDGKFWKDGCALMTTVTDWQLMPPPPKSL